MFRQIFLLTSLCCFFSSCQFGIGDDQAENPGPNLLLIVADDLGIRDLGCYGNPVFETPHLDQMASAGARFTNAYANCPVCSPSRASLMTGLYPVTVDITDWIPGRKHYKGLEPDKKLEAVDFRYELDTAIATLPEALKELGYVTGHFGKWHLGDTGFLPTDQGFDVNVGGNRFGSPPDFFWPFARYNQDGKLIREVPDVRDIGKEGSYLADVLTDQVLEFIEANRDTSFFVYFPFYLVHIPIQAIDTIQQKYETKMAQLGDTLFTNSRYAAMVDRMDWNIGRILSKLEDEGLWDNSILVFTSDNGGLTVEETPHTPATTCYPYRYGKGYLYEGGIREPLIIYGPELIKKSIINYPVAGIDLMPTLLTFAGDSTQALEGISLAPVLNNEPGPSRNLYWHYPHYSNQGGKPGSVIRNAQYKLIHFYETGEPELYDLIQDPFENRNIAADEPEVVQAMEAELQEWLKNHQAKIPTPNPEYKSTMQ